VWLEAGFEAAWIETACGIPRASIQSAIIEARNLGIRRNFGARYSAQIVNADIWTATAGRTSAIGSRRRLRALQVMGWTNEAIAAETGISFVTLASIQRGSATKVHARLYHPIREAYERLADVDGGSKYAKMRATKRGFLPPAAWDDPDTDPDTDQQDDVVDDVAIERALQGVDPLSLTAAERREAVKRHLAAGGTATSFQRITGIVASRYTEQESIPA